MVSVKSFQRRGLTNGKLNERGVGMWLLCWRGMFGAFSQPVRDMRLSAWTSPPACLPEFGDKILRSCDGGVEFEFSTAAPPAKPKINVVRYKCWRCTMERNTPEKRNIISLWDKGYVITPIVNFYFPLPGYLDCVLLVHNANHAYPMFSVCIRFRTCD